MDDRRILLRCSVQARYFRFLQTVQTDFGAQPVFAMTVGTVLEVIMGQALKMSNTLHVVLGS